MKTSLLRRLARGLLVAMALALALFAGVGAAFWDDFFVGSVFSMARWPSLLLAAGLALTVTRSSHALTRRLVLGACLVVALVHGADLSLEQLTRVRSTRPAHEGRPLSVLSYNVLFEGGRKEAVLETILAADADLVVLQEVTPQWHDLLDARLASRYPYSRARARTGTLGYAVYSRFPLGAARTVGHPRLPHAQVMTVRAFGRSFALANVHLYAPAASLAKEGMARVEGLYENAGVRAHQWRELSTLLDERYPNLPHLIVGDLNTMEHDPLYRGIERAYVDAFRTTRAGPGFTWPAMGPWPPFVRIDYVLASERFGVDEAKVLEGGSDHRAVLARLRL